MGRHAKKGTLGHKKWKGKKFLKGKLNGLFLLKKLIY